MAVFGMGCFWGAERMFWQTPGRLHHGGRLRRRLHAQPDLRGGRAAARTGHTEAVRVVFDPAKVSYDELLRAVLGEPRSDAGHAPGQRRRHASTARRSTPRRAEQRRRVERSRDAYQRALRAAGHGAITTEIADAGPFYYAEDYHQQYLAKNPGGYCGIGGTGVSCPIGINAPASP